MQITQINDGMPGPEDVSKPDDKEMQSEYHYLLAEQMTKNLLAQGLITAEEFDGIMEKNREVFAPFLARLIP